MFLSICLLLLLLLYFCTLDLQRYRVSTQLGDRKKNRSNHRWEVALGCGLHHYIICLSLKAGSFKHTVAGRYLAIQSRLEVFYQLQVFIYIPSGEGFLPSTIFHWFCGYVPCLVVEFWVRKARWNQNGHSRWLVTCTAQLQPLEYVSKSTEQSQGSVNAPKCERWFPPWSGTRVGDRAGFAVGVQKSSKRNRPLMSCFHPRNPPWKLNVIPGKAQKLRVHYVTQKLHVLESKWSRMCGPQMILQVPEMIKLFFIRMKNQLTWIHHRWFITHPNHCETIY